MPANTAEAPATGLKLRIRTTEGVTVVECHGRLTAEIAATFKEEVRGLLPQAKRVVLELGKVTYMDSSGLGAVVGLYVSAKKSGCELQLNNLTKRIRELLGMTKLLSVFETCGQYPIRMP